MGGRGPEARRAALPPVDLAAPSPAPAEAGPARLVAARHDAGPDSAKPGRVPVQVRQQVPPRRSAQAAQGDPAVRLWRRLAGVARDATCEAAATLDQAQAAMARRRCVPVRSGTRSRRERARDGGAVRPGVARVGRAVRAPTTAARVGGPVHRQRVGVLGVASGSVGTTGPSRCALRKGRALLARCTGGYVDRVTGEFFPTPYKVIVERGIVTVQRKEGQRGNTSDAVLSAG